jgi:hypothetical protein
MKRSGRIFLMVFMVACTGELFLRFYLGFCDAVLMREDPDYEYIAQPDQNRFRFRNRIMYNSFSMRSDEPDSAALKILVIGDSVINGGMRTEQDSLATARLSEIFTGRLGRNIQFLNISAGSWGPDNGYAYLRKHGDFGASAVVLVASSHDAHDNMTHEKIVGINESFPDRQHQLALGEITERYLVPKLQEYFSNAPVDESAALGINKSDTLFNTGFESLYDFCIKKNIPFVIYLHGELSELKAGDYNSQGNEILRFATERNIPVIRELNSGMPETGYRDHIHLSETGQRIAGEIMADQLPAFIPSLR